MKSGRDVSRHDELDNWRNTHRYGSVMALIRLFGTISETALVYGTGSSAILILGHLHFSDAVSLTGQGNGCPLGRGNRRGGVFAVKYIRSVRIYIDFNKPPC